MREIEILVKVLESKKSALKKLSFLKINKVVKIVDSYYYHPSNKNMQRSKALGFTEFFRLRIKDDVAYVTYKKDCFSKNQWLYADEYETEVKDVNSMKKIVECLKLQPLVTIENTRTVYLHKNYEIVLEDVKDLGLFLEVEHLNPKIISAVKIRNELCAFIATLGIKVSDEQKAGKPELMYNKIHKLSLIDFASNSP